MSYTNYIIVEMMEDTKEEDIFYYGLVHVSHCTKINEKSATFITYNKTERGIIVFDGNFIVFQKI